MISVLLPPSLAREAGVSTLTVTEPVRTVEELVGVIDRAVPGFRDQLEDALFNFAVNDELLLHRVRERTLADGDRVELVPTISGG
jgi:molybdopterin converting factor small subunit